MNDDNEYNPTIWSPYIKVTVACVIINVVVLVVRIFAVGIGFHLTKQ